MRFALMHQNFYPHATAIKVAVWFCLALAPNEFWLQVAALLEIPEVVKAAVAPLGGSLCLVIGEWVVEEAKRIQLERDMIDQGKIEALKQLRENEKLLRNGAGYFLAKVFVGWITGTFCYTLLSNFIIGPSWVVAFGGGALGHWGITVYLASRQKKMLDNDNKPQP